MRIARGSIHKSRLPLVIAIGARKKNRGGSSDGRVLVEYR
jgi:hypothetical protein